MAILVPGERLSRRYRELKLDREVARSKALDDSWTARVAVWPAFAVTLVLAITHALDVAGNFDAARRFPASAVVDALGISFAAAVTIVVGRPIARRLGGWAPAFGWSPPRLIDFPVAVAWLIGEFAVLFVGKGALVAALPALRGVTASNVQLPNTATTRVVVLAVSAVALAPPIEELIFRGLVLRTAMRWMAFWPAAALSSTVFAVLHIFDATSAAGALILFWSSVMFGISQCVLVRWTGRLAPAVTVHAGMNAVTLAITLGLRH